MTEKKRFAEKYCEDCGAVYPIPEMHKIEKGGSTAGWRCNECQTDRNKIFAFWVQAGVAFFVTYGLVGYFIAANWFTLVLCAAGSLLIGVAGTRLEDDLGRVIAWVISCAVLPFVSLASISGGHIDGYFGLAIAFIWARYLYRTRDQSAKASED